MTRDELWLSHCTEIMEFIKANNRNPSKYKSEEKRMVNWLKANRKVRNKGLLLPGRVERLRELTDLMAKFHRANQHTPPAIMKIKDNYQTITI